MAAEGNTPEQGSRRGKYTHTHTPQFCAVAVVTQQLAGLGQQQIVDPPPSHVTPNMSSHTHTHTHRRTQHHLSLLQLIKLIKLVM